MYNLWKPTYVTGLVARVSPAPLIPLLVAVSRSLGPFTPVLPYIYIILLGKRCREHHWTGAVIRSATGYRFQTCVRGFRQLAV
jgi:hypothetical protein